MIRSKKLSVKMKVKMVIVMRKKKMTAIAVKRKS